MVRRSGGPPSTIACSILAALQPRVSLFRPFRDVRGEHLSGVCDSCGASGLEGFAISIGCVLGIGSLTPSGNYNALAPRAVMPYFVPCLTSC